MTKEIKINWNDEVFTVLVDDDSYSLLSRHTWYIMFSGVNKKPYAFAEIWSKTQGKRMLYMHQIVTGSYGQTDHENGNTLDNQFLNLRPCTYQENGWNKPKNMKPRKDGRIPTSKYKGVSYKPLNGIPRWLAYFKHVESGQHKSTGKMIYIGYFSSEIEAAKAYNIKVKEMRGEFAWVNPIEGNDNSLYINSLEDYATKG